MNPSVLLSTLRPELSGSFMEFDLAMNQAGFIATEIFPVLEVGKASGEFGKVTVESLLRTLPTERAPGAGYNRSQWDFTKDTFITQEHGHESVVDDREAAIYRDYLDAEMITAERCRHIVMQNAEIRAAALIQASGTFNTTGITNEWDDHANAVPLTDVEGAVNRLWAKGIIANALILTWKQFRNLRLCDQVAEKIHSSGAGQSVLPSQITKAMLAQAFDLPKIIVAGSIKNTANQGQSASLSGTWSDEYAMVTRVADSNDISEPCIGRTFHYSEDGSTIGGTMESYYDTSVRGNVIRCRHDVQEKLLYAEAGELLSNAITI